MCAVTWYDNKPVSLLSTACSPIDGSKSLFINRWHMGGHIEIPASPVLLHYQEHMRGVDVHDQLRGYYSLQRRDHKWWHKIFFHILDQSFLNAWILYKKAMVSRGTQPISHLHFYVEIANILTEVPTAKPTCMPDAHVPNPGKLHYTMAWKGHEGRLRRVCVVCKRRRQWYCPTCNVSVCMGNCFVIHHSNP